MNELCPRYVRSFTTQLHRIEAPRSVLGRKEATDPSVRIRGDEFRGDSFLRLRLGWRRRNEEIVKRDSRALAGWHSLKAYTRKQKIIARSSAEAELYAAVLGASEPRGVESMMRDLGFAVKPVLAIDAKATEHILHQHGIGKMKHIDVASFVVAR